MEFATANTTILHFDFYILHLRLHEMQCSATDTLSFGTTLNPDHLRCRISR